MVVCLVTWEGTEARLPADRLAAILNSRTGDRLIKELVETIYSLKTASAEELASYARQPKQRPYPAVRVDIEGVAQEDAYTCGHNPWLYVRKVDDFTVTGNPIDGTDTIRWTERKRWRMGNNGAEMAIDAHRCELVRPSGPVWRIGA